VGFPVVQASSLHRNQSSLPMRAASDAPAHTPHRWVAACHLQPQPPRHHSRHLAIRIMSITVPHSGQRSPTATRIG
jgi:hypothetical protein